MLFVEARGHRQEGTRSVFQGHGGVTRARLGVPCLIGQFGGFFGVFRKMVIFGFGSYVFLCCSELLSRLWDVLCSLWRQGVTERRAKFWSP